MAAITLRKPVSNTLYVLDGSLKPKTNSTSPNIVPYASQEAYNQAQQAQNQANALLQYAQTHPASGSASANASATAISGGTAGAGSAVAPSQSTDFMAQLSAMLQAQQANQQASLRANQQEHQNLVEQAYQNNRNALLSSYGNQRGNLGSIYNDTLNQLEKNYNYGAEKIMQDRENALREAYVNRMMAQKDLPQQLNAAGLTGGASESAIAQLLNNYGNARNSIETESMNDLASLLNQYQNNANSAGQRYAQALNDLEASNFDYQRRLENDLANGVIGTYDDLYGALNSGVNSYANAMQNLATSQVNANADLAARNYANYLNSLNKSQSSSKKTSSASSSASAGSDSSIIANVLRSGGTTSEMLQELVASGMSKADAVKALRNAGYSL